MTITNIQLISTNTIKTTNHVGDTNIDLTPWDLILLKTEAIQQGLLFPKPETNRIQHLKQTLSSALNLFPPLVGRLEIKQYQDDQHNTMNTSCSILCNNAGALFIHAKAENTTIADIIKPDYIPSIVHSFFPLNGVKNYKGTSQPLLAVQVTELIDGVFVGFAVNHVVADGKMLWLFINSWAEISRHSDSDTFNKVLLNKIPSSFQRWFPKDIKIPIKFPYTEESSPKQRKQCEVPPLRIFHFTKEKILQLKSKANEKIANDDKNITISSLQALITHIWGSIISNQNIEPEEDTSFMLMIDSRTRMCPSLGENYFGNAGLPKLVTIKAGELKTEGENIGKVGMKINKMISMESSHEKMVNFYEFWLNKPLLITPGMAIRSNVFVANSSPRFDVYGNDFGWGKPIAVRNGIGNKSNGKVTLLAGADEGSIDVEICLPHHVLEAMASDHALFMDADAISVN